MHLALSQVDRLMRPEADAQRLFLADELLDAGLDADAIIRAIEADAPDFEGLRKFDPDQPRVPAGSGRASGQWTSGGGAGAPSTADPQQPEVNPGTITDAEYYDACKAATIDCIDVAASVNSDNGDAANDNYNEDGFKADLTKCRQADFACNLLSIAIEDIPLLDYGGVIFPHQGVVLMQKGRQDRYIPPLPGGRRPSFRRSL
jgi:hypothetical protein